MRMLVVLFAAFASFHSFCQDGQYHLDVDELDKGIYLYRSYFDYEGQRASANGIIAEYDDEVVVIDTPWDTLQTIELIDWVERETGKPISLFIITHAHQDRMGGISVVNKKGLRSISSMLTMAYALRRGFEPPTITFEKDTVLRFGKHEVEVFYPGPGHTVENTVVYLHPWHLLYGGCFLKSAQSPTLGYIEDADLNSWATSIDKVQARFPHAKKVIPGHGSLEDGAIENTLLLLGKQ